MLLIENDITLTLTLTLTLENDITLTLTLTLENYTLLAKIYLRKLKYTSMLEVVIYVLPSYW
jgi:hypothetical protein